MNYAMSNEQYNNQAISSGLLPPVVLTFIFEDVLLN
jgi:hypothetical protein